MKHASAVLALLLLARAVQADPLPKAVPSAPCQSPPTIDGTIGADEWKAARHFAFDLEMARLNPAAKTTVRASCG